MTSGTFRRACSEAHGKRLWKVEHPEEVKASKAWGPKRRDAYHRRRALKRGNATGRPVDLLAIAERDEWTCQLCHEPVDPALQYPDPMSKSEDHVLPLSKGGAHDPDNVQLAHLRCNVIKGARTPADLMEAS